MERDIFTFSVENLQEIKFTKRGLLSKLSSLFDPLGFTAPITVKAKTVCRG